MWFGNWVTGLAVTDNQQDGISPWQMRRWDCLGKMIASLARPLGEPRPPVLGKRISLADVVKAGEVRGPSGWPGQGRAEARRKRLAGRGHVGHVEDERVVPGWIFPVSLPP